jgi:hypothetical protein
MKKLVYTLLLSFSFVLNAQETSDFINAFNIIAKDIDSLHFYTALKRMRNNDSLYKSDMSKSTYFQALATAYAFNGICDSALKYTDMGAISGALRQGKRSTEGIDLSRYVVKNATDYILSLSKNQKILIFNEAHTVPQNRLFVKSFLPELYKQGYRYLALEALPYYEAWFEEENRLDRRASTYAYWGYYTKESCFSELIREAIKLGFYIYGYEPNKEQENFNRHYAQAKNISEIFEDDPDAKVVVLSGHGNAQKSGTMYKELKRLSNNIPLLINQSTLREHATKKYERPQYVAFTEQFNADRPVVLMDTLKKCLYALDTFFDIYVFSPRTIKIHKRPDWLLENGARQAINIQKYKKITHPCIVKAYPFERARTKCKSKPSTYYVFTDQLVIEKFAKNSEYYLFLPKGIYLIEYQNLAETKVLKWFYIEVK